MYYVTVMAVSERNCNVSMMILFLYKIIEVNTDWYTRLTDLKKSGVYRVLQRVRGRVYSR